MIAGEFLVSPAKIPISSIQTNNLPVFAKLWQSLAGKIFIELYIIREIGFLVV
jgi:hypothetical protein